MGIASKGAWVLWEFGLLLLALGKSMGVWSLCIYISKYKSATIRSTLKFKKPSLPFSCVLTLGIKKKKKSIYISTTTVQGSKRRLKVVISDKDMLILKVV